MVFRTRYCDISLVKLSENNEVVLEENELYSAPILPQILNITGSKLLLKDNDISCIIGVDGSKYCIGAEGGVVYSVKGMPLCRWKPFVSLDKLEDFLEEHGIIGEGGSEIIFNPLFTEACFLYDRTIICMKPFSAKIIEEKIVSKSFSEVVFESRWRLVIGEKKIILISPIGVKYTINIDHVDTMYDSINDNYVVEGGGLRFIANKRRNLMYIHVFDTSIDMESNLVSYKLSYLNPYYVAKSFVEEKIVFKTNSGWVLVEEPHVLGIVNPGNNEIVLGRKVSLKKGVYVLLPLDKKNYGIVHSNYLASLISLQHKQIVFSGRKAIRYDEYMARMYPFKLLVGDIIYREDGVKLVLFNHLDTAVLAEFYSVFPVEAIVYNARYPKGYKPVSIKPNLFRVALGPYEVAVMDILFKQIPIRMLRYMLFVRGSMH